MPNTSMAIQPVNILLVDDKHENLVALVAMLGRPEYNLVTATSGPEAIRKLFSDQFAAVLLDIMMPEMDGFEVASLIKRQAHTRNTPIIFLTAASHDLNKIYRAYSLGGVDYLQKPLDADIVKAKVAVFVDLFQKTAQIEKQNELIRKNERREREYQLTELKRLGERRYRKLADAIPHIVWITDAKGDIEYFNKRWFEYTHLPIEESRSWGSVHSMIHPQEVGLFSELWHSSVQSGKKMEIECRLRHSSSDKYRWHLCRALPELGSSGEIVAWLGTFTDIEAQKMAEEQLFLTREAADAANKAKSQFLANMSHEIRTPLGAILGYTELIFDAHASLQDRNVWLGNVKRNCLHLSNLVEDVLDLSKIEAGQLDIEESSFNLADVISEVCSFMVPQASAKGLTLQVDNKCEGVALVKSDPVRLRQILLNIVGNAIKFTETGGVSLEIKCQPREGDKSKSDVVFVVKDTGSGISKEQSERLFQPFMQADKSTSRKFGGTGLGLALSRRLAIALGGSLNLSESIPGKGSTFTLTIGAVKDTNDPLPTLPEPRRVANDSTENGVSDSPLRGLQVLVVDDAPDNQTLFRKFLEIAGAKVELAENGQQGVEKALRGAHDLVLMDIQMPELDGYQAVMNLRQMGYPKPIIALTAHVLKDERERCLRVGYNDYLSKPVNRRKLLDVIARYAKAGVYRTEPQAGVEPATC